MLRQGNWVQYFVKVLKKNQCKPAAREPKSSIPLLQGAIFLNLSIQQWQCPGHSAQKIPVFREWWCNHSPEFCRNGCYPLWGWRRWMPQSLYFSFNCISCSNKMYCSPYTLSSLTYWCYSPCFPRARQSFRFFLWVTNHWHVLILSGYIMVKKFLPEILFCKDRS